LTDAQVAANVALVRWLCSEHAIEVLIGHHEYQGLQATAWFDEKDPDYRTTKVDPGPAFMARVRAEVGDLHLQNAD
jgi:N-acetylmuramoyl-L-alanine amidase